MSEKHEQEIIAEDAHQRDWEESGSEAGAEDCARSIRERVRKRYRINPEEGR
ncbi:MAG: hypothetical protein ACREIS_00790 [Nitrospiraceae bacterium]